MDFNNYIEEKVIESKETIKGKAIIAVSGGVDSSVAAAIVGKAIGENLHAIFVDTGYMRKNEGENVIEALHSVGINATLVDAADEFYSATELPNGTHYQLPLEQVVEPEIKRKIIGTKFIKIFEREAKKVGAEYLIQGTIAPDWIESGDGKIRDNIKSHHNVGALPEKMGLKLYEPNHELYKDEVRKAGRAFGFPKYITERQPFPGPGLAIRVIGPPNRENIAVVREANAILEEGIESAVESGKMEAPQQYLAVYLPGVKTVGVHGDVRSYAGAIALRCFSTSDFMSGIFSKVDLNVIEIISTKITNTLKDKINRVVYDVTNKPPGTTEWE